MGAPATLTADLTGADGLTLQVRCESPTGSVVFSPATLEAEAGKDLSPERRAWALTSVHIDNESNTGSAKRI